MSAQTQAAVDLVQKRLEPYLSGTARLEPLDEHPHDKHASKHSMWHSVLGAFARKAAPAGEVCVLSGTMGAARRYRCENIAEQLHAAGLAAHVGECDSRSLAAAGESAAAAVLHRVPWSADVARFVDAVHCRQGSVWFNLDDLLFRPDHVNHLSFSGERAAHDAQEHRELAARYFQTLIACDGVIASTEPLAKELRSATAKPVHVVLNAASEETLQRSALARARLAPFKDGALVLGYLSGTPTHDRDLAVALHAVTRLLRERHDAVLVLVGFADARAFPDDVRDHIVHLPFQDWRQLPDLIRRLDLVLAPLETPNRFTECKSEVKYVEAGLVGVPTIATATEAFANAIEDGKNGWLVSGARSDEWFAKLSLACADARRREAAGDAALRDCLKRYTPQARSALLSTLVRQRLAAPPRMASSVS